MSRLQIRHEYKISNHDIYLGLLQNVTSVFNLNETINTAGAQLQVTVGQSADIAVLPISPITDETGTPITDETGTPILPERQPDVVGSASNNTLIQNDNDIEVWEYSNDNPNGVCVFRGYISKWKATFGKTDDILITCLSYGQDLSNYLIYSPALVLDQSQTSTNDLFAGPITIGGNNINYVGQQVTIGAGVTNIAAITMRMASFDGLPHTARVYVWNNYTDAQNGVPPLASASNTFSSTTVTDYLFTLTTPVSVTAGNQYFIATLVDNEIVFAVYDASSVYSGGVLVFVGSGISYPTATADMYFKTWSGIFNTTGGYTTTDTSTIFTKVIQNYNSQGGKVQIPAAGYSLSGQTVTYSFKSQTVLQGVQAIQGQLAPPDWWWYADPSDSTLYFAQTATAADFLLIKGRHINDLEIEATKEGIVNVVYFTGGDDGTGKNIFVQKIDTASITANRIGMALLSDNRVNSTAGGATTAALIAQNYINNNNSETYITTVTLDNSTIDTTKLKIGKIIGFAGFGNFVDSLLLQIVARNRTATQTVLTLGTLPARPTQQIKDIQSDLNYLQTVANPTAPS